ncbi:hypothetical protein LCGC14_1535940 [marine sediment metagenome]|uniref:Uncharacterized protein n=1 Tax=marine sediment metagenome TaxID=412755 RepID=A0A0F9IUM2_9ZZZZ
MSSSEMRASPKPAHCCEPTPEIRLMRAMELQKALGHLRAMECTFDCCDQCDQSKVLRTKTDEFVQCLCDCDCC